MFDFFWNTEQNPGVLRAPMTNEMVIDAEGAQGTPLLARWGEEWAALVQIHMMTAHPALESMRPAALRLIRIKAGHLRACFNIWMALYEAKFIDNRDEVFATQIFGAEHDQAAKDYAHRMLKTPFGKGHEIWQGSRLVHRELYE